MKSLFLGEIRKYVYEITMYEGTNYGKYENKYAMKERTSDLVYR